MDMLRRFCEISVDKKGNKMKRKGTENYRIFKNKYRKNDTFKHLNIYKDKEFFMKRFGKYPVIYLDFKILNSTSFDGFLKDFMELVRKEFMRHSYLLNSSLVESYSIMFKELKRYYKKILNYSLNESDLKYIMNFLSYILLIHFNKKVIVLIDEYDSPIQKAIFDKGKDLNKIIYFMKKFSSHLLDSNFNVKRALLNTSEMPSEVAKTIPNNIKKFPYNKKHSFAKYYQVCYKNK